MRREGLEKCVYEREREREREECVCVCWQAEKILYSTLLPEATPLLSLSLSLFILSLSFTICTMT